MDKQIDEIMSILQEECAEVIQMVSKVRRFGEFNHHPDEPDLTNLAKFKQELGDVIAMIELLAAHDYIDMQHIHMLKHEKFDKLRKWSDINIDYDKLKYK
jgi:NTP pyrophosphatase (non-canonical NTP hydrolase)